MGETVLDPFAGVASTVVAALRCSRTALGFELDPQHHALGSKRVSDVLAESTVSKQDHTALYTKTKSVNTSPAASVRTGADKLDKAVQAVLSGQRTLQESCAGAGTLFRQALTAAVERART